MFKKLVIHNWRQFSDIEVDFHARLTILTGANGTGKTTILQLLNRHWGWNLQFVSTPRFTSKGIRRYWAGFWSEEDDQNESKPQPKLKIGDIEYKDSAKAELFVPENVQETFAVEIRNQPALRGVFVPSHRPPYIFQRVEQIPAQLDAKDQIFKTYLNELMARFNAGGRTQSPAYRIKTSLISLATFGYGNEAVDRNEDAVKTFEGFENILRTILPPTLKFRRIRVRVPDVLLDTETGSFSFDAVSGGVAALIDISWQIFIYSLLFEDFVVIIDEPEAHLHPALQQRLLPDLLKVFPRTQFIVATHNPFVVSSVPDSNVYVLNYNEELKVESKFLDLVNKAGSANEILRDVLGVPFTLPIWVDDKIQEIIDDFSQKEITEESLAELRQKMSTIGLEHLFPETLTKLLQKK